MKKFLAFATLASVALVGCVNDEKMEMTSGAQKISFDNPVMSTQTRAKLPGEMYKETKGDNLYNKTEEFVVYAVKHSGNFAAAMWNSSSVYMNAVKVSYDAELKGWKDATKKDWYWPEDGDKLTFAAYSPAELTGTVSKTDAGMKLENFEVPTNPSQQYDLMYSNYAKDCINTSIKSDGNYTGVPLEFQHALSAIRFSIVKDQKVEEVATLDGISISGIQYKGTLYWNVGDNATSAAWESLADETGYTVFAGTTPQTFTADKAEPSQDADLLLLPQILTDNAKVKINYTLDGTKYEKEFALKDFKSGDTSVNQWNMGKKYHYVISLDADIIYFAPKPSDWDVVDNIMIRL